MTPSLMEVSLPQPALHAALRKAHTATGITGQVRLVASPGQLDVTAHSNGHTTMLFATELDADIASPGHVTVNIRQLLPAVKSFTPDNLTLIGNDIGLGLSAGDINITLHASDHPACIADRIPAPGVAVGGVEFRRAVATTVRTVATDRHPVFGNVWFDRERDGGQLRLVGTDTFRLAAVRVPSAHQTPAGFQVDAPSLKRAVKALGKKVRYDLAHADGRLWIGAGGMTVGIETDDTAFPRYRAWASETRSTVTVARRPLADLLNRAVTLAGKKTPPPVYLTMTADMLEVTSETGAGTVSGSFHAGTCDMPDKPTRLGFNGKFLFDAVDTLEGDQVSLMLPEDPTERPKPIKLISAPACEVWHLVMPTRG